MAVHTLCNVNDIQERQGRGFDAGSEASVLLVKKDGQIYGYINRCPHLEIRLEWKEDEFMDSDGVLIECSTHGALFNIEDGECIMGPCQGDYLTPVEVLIVNDQVQVVIE